MKTEAIIIFFAFFLVIMSSLASASLGISPAKREIAFTPGEVIELGYKVYSDNPEEIIDLFLGGDLEQYARLDKDTLTGTGSFKVFITLPDNLDSPGMHTISVGAKQRPREDQFIGTVVDIRSTIYVFAPYPGRYAEIELFVPDGNIDEQIPIEVKVINRGKEDLNVAVNVDFFNEKGEILFSMPFTPVLMGQSDEKYFRKFLDTSGYLPGNYLADAEAVYGTSEDKSSANRSFRIGSLFVNITNFTESLPRKGIQKFIINIENKWNGEIREVYADVNLTNGVENITFRTPSTDLSPWNNGALTGFLDTDELEGEYTTYIVLSYAGQQTIASGKLVIEEFNLIMLVIIGIIALAIIAYLAYRLRKKFKNRK